MAQKRMFDKRVIESDTFTDLPNSSKALYFMAGMSADDKGFFQPRRLQKMCGFSDDDFKILIAKRFFIAFESGVMVITDWNKNNWLDSRRITETEYINELNLLKLINEKYELLTESEINAKPMLSQYSIEENRIEENRIDKNNNSDCYNVTNCNEDVTNTLVKYLEKNFVRTISPLEYEKLNDWIKDFNEEMVKYAIDLSILNNKKTFSYIAGILKNWKTNGYKTLADVKEEKKEIKKENMPKWVNEPIQETTQEDQQEFDDILTSFK